MSRRKSGEPIEVEPLWSVRSQPTKRPLKTDCLSLKLHGPIRTVSNNFDVVLARRHGLRAVLFQATPTRHLPLLATLGPTRSPSRLMISPTCPASSWHGSAPRHLCDTHPLDGVAEHLSDPLGQGPQALHPAPSSLCI